MSLNILIIGQCTLHWGRMEFGNIGNYYIMEPFFEELNTVFSDREVRTTLQMSSEFCDKMNIDVLPMDVYYGWNDVDLENAEKELQIAEKYNKTGIIEERTPYIEQVEWADIVIDFSGDIWGDNANFLGDDRFLVGLYKDYVAQLFGKPTVMLAGSPGPFKNTQTTKLAKKVYSGFNLVTNRESISTNLLKDWGFDISNTKSLVCPSFLFKPDSSLNINEVFNNEQIPLTDRKKAGFILCGWNFEQGPFDKWPREDSDYFKFAETIEYMIHELHLDVILMSHSNGFPIPPKEFQLLHGRDYPIIKQLQKVLAARGVTEHIYSLDGVYDAWQTKAIIGNFDLLVSGRVHGAIAGLSQAVPTVIIDYGHEPKAHKLKGFAQVAQVEEFVANPTDVHSMKEKVNLAWTHSDSVRKTLNDRLPTLSSAIRQNFELTKQVINESNQKP